VGQIGLLVDPSTTSTIVGNRECSPNPFESSESSTLNQELMLQKINHT